MRHENIGPGLPMLDAQVAADVGELTITCIDTAGHIDRVREQLTTQVVALNRLEQVTAELESDQAQVARATEEARILTAKAVGNIEASAGQIASTVDEFTQLTNLIDRLGRHVVDFGAALEQVQAVSGTIETIAKTTNMLALNASIEAERAGDAGRTFAVVASEIKKLASHTRAATDEIRRTVSGLGSEAEELVREIRMGVEASHRSEAGFDRISNALAQAIETVGLIDGQGDQIAHSASLIHANGQLVQRSLGDFADGMRAGVERLVAAHHEIEHTESLSNRVFNAVIGAGVSPDDSTLIAIATGLAAKAVDAAEAALKAGALSPDQLFDSNYQIIPGSMPERYRTALTDWADRHWRPLIDAGLNADRRILMNSMADMNGFLPTHVTDRSRAPTGDIKHDTQYCRNGRILFSRTDSEAKRSTAPYFLAVYRQEGDGADYVVVRNIYVPMIIAGRRWGDYELAYRT
jgi:methyl-accepting chemotaxis protein